MFARLARFAALLILSLVLATVCSALLAQEGALGSCFEGSCGYIGAFFCVPLLTTAFYIFFKKVRNRWLGPKSLRP